MYDRRWRWRRLLGMDLWGDPKAKFISDGYLRNYRPLSCHCFPQHRSSDVLHSLRSTFRTGLGSGTVHPGDPNRVKCNGFQLLPFTSILPSAFSYPRILFLVLRSWCGTGAQPPFSRDCQGLVSSMVLSSTEIFLFHAACSHRLLACRHKYAA